MGDINIDWMHLEAINNSGGILTKWHKDIFTCNKQILGQWFVGVAGKYCKHGQNKVLAVVINVYSLCNINDKHETWEEIPKVKLMEDCKQQCVLGDFNAVRKLFEKGCKLQGQQYQRRDQGV